ncbi:hypothetical protein DWB84_12650 [Saccharophagus sp. K07]|nr:hypothetical protein [Saccharophagus sp. K07]
MFAICGEPLKARGLVGDIFSSGNTATAGDADGLMGSFIAEEPALERADIVFELIEQESALAVVLVFADAAEFVLGIKITEHKKTL